MQKLKRVVVLKKKKKEGREK